MVVGGLREARAAAQLPQPVLEANEVQLVEHVRFEAVCRRYRRRIGSNRQGGEEDC